MANYFNLTLDTLAPSNPKIVLAGGAPFATADLINATISTSDSSTSGYQMAIWGDIDLEWAKTNSLVNSGAQKVDEASAQFNTFTGTKQLKLAAGDGVKTVYVKLRDDVHNVSAQASSKITLDTKKPIVTVTAADVSKISKNSGKDTASFSFSSNEAFVQYKVCVVSAIGAAESAGKVIPVTAGSTNMQGTGNFNAITPIQCSIKGADLETASSGDGVKIIKVFVKDKSGLWSV